MQGEPVYKHVHRGEATQLMNGLTLFLYDRMAWWTLTSLRGVSFHLTPVVFSVKPSWYFTSVQIFCNKAAAFSLCSCSVSSHSFNAAALHLRDNWTSENLDRSLQSHPRFHILTYSHDLAMKFNVWSTLTVLGTGIRWGRAVLSLASARSLFVSHILMMIHHAHTLFKLW